MFVNLFVKNDKWVNDHKAAFALFDDFGVGVSVISTDMEILALNKVMKRWFPEIDVDKKPICYTAFNNPPQSEKCPYCPTYLTLKDGRVHEAVTETPRDGAIINFRVVSSPVKDKDGKIIAAIEVVEDVTEQMLSYSRIEKLNECLLHFGPDYAENINRLTAITGKLLGATCALYNRFDGGLLCSIGQWNAPKDYKSEDKAEGHICFDVIEQAKDGVLVIRNLQQSKYAKSDPNVQRYNLQTYVGKAVKCNGKYIGSICAVFQKDAIPTQEDKRFLGVIASAIGIEEERKVAEAALRSSEDLYHSTINSMGYSVHVIDTGFRIIFINSVFTKWMGELGFKADRVGESLFEAMPFLGQKVRKEYEQVINTGKPFVSEETNVFAGREIMTNTQKIPILEGGKVKKIVTIVRDITQQKKNEKLLNLVRRQQEAILDNIPDIAWLKDNESRFIAVNGPFAKSCGYKPKDITGKDDFFCWPKDLAETYRADDAEVMRTGKRKVIEEPLHSKGGILWVETIKTPIYNEKGEVVGTTGIARDITVRKKLEHQLKQSEEKFRKFFEDANDAIFIADMKTGELVDVNRQAERLIGLPRQKIIGRNQIMLHPPEEAENYKEKFIEITRDALASKDSQNPSLEGEVINSKGERIPVYISASIMEIGGRKLAQGIFRDISELRRIEREKKEAEALALIDPHTQLYNYRYLQRRIHSEFELAKRRATPLSVLMIDIDYFKSVNDTFGHEYGDAVLQEFAILLQHTSRGIDVVTRFEGEGFALILPDTEGKGAFTFAERIQRIIKKHRFGSNKVKLRISIGICSYPEDGVATVDNLLTTADKCVRFAKDQGGDTISIASQLRGKKQAAPVPSDEISQKRVNTITKKFMELIRRNRQNTIEAVYALAHTVGAKNAYTEEHSEEMVNMSTAVGRRLNLTDQEIEDLKHGAMLHDIGKLGISEKILLKRGKLTKKEFEAIKKHPQIGADIIRPVHFLKDVVPIILHHHERFDGYGYGAKLKGEEIPIGARIIAVVDVFQALVSNRPYRKAYSKREALKIIKEETGTHFDPKVVKVFLEVVSREKQKKTRR